MNEESKIDRRMENIEVAEYGNARKVVINRNGGQFPCKWLKKQIGAIAMAFALSCFCFTPCFAGQNSDSQEDGSHAYFSERGGVATSTAETSDRYRENANHTAPQRLTLHETEQSADSGIVTINTREESFGQAPVHNAILPFADYFIDTQIVGAVRYQADFPLEEKQEFLQELADIQNDLLQYLAMPQPRETIEVFFFQSEKSYLGFLDKEFPNAPYDRRALYIKQSGPGMVLIFQGPNIQEDLRHEMTHAFLHAALPYVPLWLDEGLAEYFEKPRESRANVNPYFKKVSSAVRFWGVPALARLEKLSYFDQMGTAEYCEAWSWVHFMIHHSRETHEILAGYMQLLAEYGEETPALESYLTKAVPDLKKSYQEHFRNWNLRNSSDSKTEKPIAQKKDEKTITRGWSESIFR